MYTCNECGKSFKVMSKLVRHNNRQTPCRTATHHCNRCRKGFTSYQSLWQHKQHCKGESTTSSQHVPAFIERTTRPAASVQPFYTPVERKRSRDTADGSEKFDDPTFNSTYSQQQNIIPTISDQFGAYQVKKNPTTIQAITTKTNPRIQALLNEIVNDGTPPPPPPEDKTITTYTPLVPVKPMEKPFTLQAMQELRPITIDEVRQLSQPEEPLFRSKEVDVVRFSDDNDDNDDDDQSDDGTIDISNLPPPDKVKFLPETVDGLTERFNELFREFWQECKHSHRNELVFLLDELKRQGGITDDTYKRINTLLAKSLGSGIDDSTETAMEVGGEEEEQLSEEDQLKKTIASTADYLIQHDKKELLEIVHEIEKDEDIIDVAIELEELIVVYLESEYLERESVAEKIHKLVDSLSQSKHVPRSLLLKIKMLVNDIAKNRARVKDIVNRFIQAGDDSKSRLWIIKQLVKEELLSEQQYFKLIEIVDDLDLATLISVIQETKIGQGMDFLPRKTGDLIDSLREWMQEFVEKGGTTLQNKISSVLNELLRRKTISAERYSELKEENNIL